MPCVAALRPSLHCFFFVPCQQGVALAEAAAEMDALGEWADLAERKAAADGSVEEARAAADTLAAEVEGRVAAVEGELAEVEGQLAQAQDGQAAAGGAGGRTTGCGCALALGRRGFECALFAALRPGLACVQMARAAGAQEQQFRRAAATPCHQTRPVTYASLAPLAGPPPRSEPKRGRRQQGEPGGGGNRGRSPPSAALVELAEAAEEQEGGGKGKRRRTQRHR